MHQAGNLRSTAVRSEGMKSISESRGWTNSRAGEGPRLGLAEREFRTVLDAIEDRILHHSDRPEVELRILGFLAGARGPTVDGIARELNVSRSAAEAHLRSLENAGRVWAQRVRGGARAWHLTLEGKHFWLQRRSGDSVAVIHPAHPFATKHG